MNIKRSCFSALLGAAMIGAWLQMASAETLTLKSGEKIEGTILRSLGHTLTFKLQGQGMRQLAIDQIDQIDIPLDSGDRLAGRLVGWSNDVHQIEVDGQVWQVSDGQLIDDDEVVAKRDGESEEKAADGSGGPKIAVLETPDVLDAPSDDLPVLTAFAEPVKEGMGNITFTLKLSSMSDRPVVVIYAAIDRSAKDGTDYRRDTGVLTIKAGSDNASITIPLVDDDLAEPNETFDLFLSVDPAVARTEKRHIEAKIEDDDH